ncbi:MAG: glycoside hydrolase family 3 C-terminal domain-containing protein, partial [Bacteroidales bacterium]|nr:glycoside hydrolase family 3 C-terminal domain-containing protein [Bacteroidales bacterium]
EMETAALAMEAGTHLEMPGWKWYSAEKIQQAFDDGSLSGELFNKRLREVLEIKLSDWIKNPEEYKDSPFNLEQQTALIRRIGSESAVLLKNSGDILPIKKGQKIALFGPFADSDLIKGLQGSSTNRTKRNISVKQALEEEGFDVVYQQAVTGLPPVNQEQKVFFESKAEYFDNINLEGKPKIIRYEKDIQKISFSGAGAAEITDGTIDKAFQFNGQSLLKIGQTPGVKENEDFTWSFWVYLPDQFPDKNGGLLAGYFRRWNEFTFTPSYFTMFLFGPRKKIKLEHTISDQQWSNVVLVRRKGKMISYVNGKKQSEQVFNYALPAAELAIGGSNVTDKNSNCLIDDVRLYNRALSEEEIANTFKKNNTKDGLVFHQPCDNLDKVKEDIESYDEIENPNNLSARFTGVFKPAKSGKYIFNIFSNGGVRFYLEGEEKLNLWNEKWVMGLDHRVWLELEKGKEYNIKVEFGNWYGYNRGKGGFIKMGYYEPDGKILDDIEEASYLAVDADVAVVAVGVPQTPYQGESNDLDHFQLPGYQNELIEMVQNVNPNTVVLLFSAGGVDMNPWLENTQGLVEMFFPGEMGGYCVADVLTGKVNPSGKLPVTYYQSLEDIGVTNYQVKYEDNVYGLGYKYLDKTGKKALFPFGFGLSYTQFKMKGLKVETEGNRVTVKLKVTNEGNKDGAEVIQAYVSDLEASVDQPVKELGGFNKVFLKAGETKEVTINIAEIALGYYSVKDKKWVIEPGKFEITVGNSSVNLPLKKTIEL